jgi:excisionase family DNA binding protein
MADDELLTVPEIAAWLKLHPETVRSWLRRGKLHGMRVSDSMGWRVPASEVDRFIQEALQADGKGGHR